jgi:hypothetical protein
LEDLVVGRTTLRDEVVQRLDCSMLEAEHMVDTLVARGFVRQASLNDGREALLIGES